ncbi:Fic family protein [Aquiflexum balticum DSM 16537]|uniref:Fic family protein n=1 Tax=Aquiflexum balticum DSM 16537 TaxID=758820 RepID=A0A1W2H1P4_9BACT|nr:Fic/DOC family N-terminal domain-containing protein [Aquiflexum balticum]SMD42406.1 Fic family protein [Aquiflexum balticum DSM 16537]
MAYLINPDRTKPWNNLPELPIEAQYYRDLDIFEQLGEAKAAIARLQGRSAAIPNQGMLINTISLQEAKASSEIENIFTTDDELYKAFSDETIKQGPTKEILHYRESIWKGHQYLVSNHKFDIPYFELIYQTITGMSDGIRKPFAHTFIRQGGSGPNAGKAVYTPPRGEGVVEAKMENLIHFMNDDNTIDPILKMAIGHLQFEAIHPFRDGNGRTGRLFNIHFLTQKGLLDLPILFLSKFILDRKEDYYAFLAGVTQRSAWKDWLIFMLKAVEITSMDTYHKINDILAAKDSILHVLENETNIIRPESLVEAIFTQPYTKVKHLTDKKIYAENTARQYLNQIAEMGIVERREISGGHYYMNLELYRILGE